MGAASLIGFRWADRHSANFTWGELSKGWGLSLEILNWSEDSDWSLCVQFIYGRAYIKLPFLPRREPKEQMLDGWGFSWRCSKDDHATLHVRWGHRSKCIWLPWSAEWQRTSSLLKDGAWDHETKGHRRSRRGEGIEAWHERIAYLNAHQWSATYPYRYTLKSGEIQDRLATVKVQEMEWRPRWLQWLPLAKQVRRSIDVSFDGEVGERSGSWKGGTFGCGYDLRAGETPEQALRRMESERTFR